uniref:AlNc14C162G7805 protein n=1 Tax=Albugo laibachii Nc14 TaxID=890382 RepID=F0WMW9_9STRA|nr:AlNc14C162G7805 [Albugo laibachii Nc14]|eukprot:CCA22654.1 AlNc14C162G7805 [Albugo laibachii Nc14]
MENFSNKFRNKTLRNTGWKLEKALTPIEYTKRADQLAKLNKKAVEWMEDVDKTNWATAYSPCARFAKGNTYLSMNHIIHANDISTRNNVESVNSTLMAARLEPLLDCLMTIEKYVSGYWVEFTSNMTKWGQLDDFAEKKLVADALPAVKRGGQLSAEYANDQDKAFDPCSCAYFQYLDARSVNVVESLKHINNLSILLNFIGMSWTKAVYKQAYDS